MRILVTGGTGFLGKQVVRKLSGENIVVLARHIPRKEKKFILGDVTDREALEKAFPADIVIHLAGSIDSDDPKLYKINVEGTRNVAEFCKKYKTKQLIYMGSAGAIGNTKIAREDSERNPKTKYEKSKSAAEDIITSSGLNYTIIRAPVLFGPSPIWLGVVKAAKNNFPILGKGENHFHVAYVDDVAELVKKCVNNRKAFGQTFHVATKDTPTYREFYEMICSELDIEMTKKTVPVLAAKILSLFHTISSKILRKPVKPILKGENIERITRDRIISTEKAEIVLGFVPKHTTRQAIHETINQFKKAKLI